MRKLSSFALMFCFVLVLNTGAINAQNKTDISKQLDEVQFRVLYESSQQAKKYNETIILTDTMALNVGLEYSEYYDWHKPKLDSLSKLVSKNFDVLFIREDDEELNQRLDAGEIEYDAVPRSPETSKIFKERAKENIKVFDNGPYEAGVGSTYLVLDEHIPLNWSITDETSSVLNYTCRKAETTFRGRTYNVWFTTEIPINDGPWKLYGLPGLILKAETTDSIFKFVAIGVEKVENTTISYPDDRKLVQAKNLKQLQDFRKNERRKTDIILVKGKIATAYMTANPLTLNVIEIDE